MSLGTTRSSTGTVNGASTLLEDRLGKKLLYLACRHHVHKLIIEKALSIVVSIPEVSSGENIKLFQWISQQ